MFGEGHPDSIVQRGIDEALACRDLLPPAPASPSLMTRLFHCFLVTMRLKGMSQSVLPKARDAEGSPSPEPANP